MHSKKFGLFTYNYIRELAIYLFSTIINPIMENWRPTKSRASYREKDEKIVERDSFLDLEIEDKEDLPKTRDTLIQKQNTSDYYVIRVWEEISNYIKKCLSEGISVKISGLGTFTYDIDAKNSEDGNIQIITLPVFVPSPFVVQMYDLILENEENLTTNFSVIQLKYEEISKLSCIATPIVEGVVTEVLLAFARALSCNKNIEFPFVSIGKLQIENRKLKMRFYENFCKNMKFSVPIQKKEGIIEGRMTPLSYHIPTTNFKSVFHLREIRGVSQVPKTKNPNILGASCSATAKEVIEKGKFPLSYSTISKTLRKSSERCKSVSPLYKVKIRGRNEKKDNILQNYQKDQLSLLEMLEDHHYIINHKVLGEKDFIEHFKGSSKDKI